MIDFISQYAASYRSKIRTAEQAAQVVKSGDWIDIGMGAGFASLMDAALAKRKDELWGVNVRGYLIHEPIQMVECDPERKHFIYNSWHMSAYERKLSDRGLCNYTSMVFRNLGHYYRNYLTVNVAMVAVTPMNAQGYFNFSISNAATREVLNRADIVIVEVNENLPWVFGGLDECIHVDDVDIVVEGEHGPLPHLDSAPATAEDRKIAELVVRRMVNGSTLQLGIGSLPNTVGSILAESDLKDFGVHTEMLCDSYLDLRRSGKITNRMKGIDRYKSVFGFALGAQELYDWVRENSGVVSYPVAYCNNATNLAKLENFVSINSCIAVDIYGQICAETAGMRHISGTGGQLDFLEGAVLSPGGQAFICLTSSFTDKQGNVVSRIKPNFSDGDVVTDPRSLAFYIVTEYGCVNLMGCSAWERSERLISVAHPMFRDELIAAAEKQGIWIRSNKR